ncbi:hypothetical protein COLO4_04444 [Corchorus olitorius]|uniref:Uncharacterized protein n=1 Tax=Corchorus olitorius TaxID=93759 RepID=A0A1R3KU01_9ROSI|nr:hypothetical protein COLO4_04444 [Corchorus olitorius]
MIREAHNPGVYLGFHSTWGKTGVLHYIVERVEAKLNVITRTLSLAEPLALC